MRSILFFDLPTLTLEQQKGYRCFIKNLTKEGWYRIQESVFVKLNLNQLAAESSINHINELKPKSGNIFVLTVTEKQFAKMKILQGVMKSDVIFSDKRIIHL